MNRFEAMSVLVAVADQRGFAPAARKLGLSPSAVTRSVAALERHLSTRLLHRTTRRVALTDAGARYVEQARRILSELGEAEAAARATRVEPSGRFAVAAPLVFGRREVAPVLSEFLARFPGVTGLLSLSDRIVDLVEEGLDLAVRIGHLKDSSLVVRTVGATRRVLVASPSYLAGRRRLRTPADLATHALIQVTGLSPLPEWRFVRGRREARVPLRPAFVTNSADAAVTHAERGGGVALVLSYQADEQLRSGTLVRVLTAYEAPPIPIQLVHPGTRLATANVRAFTELVLSTRRWNFAGTPAAS